MHGDGEILACRAAQAAGIPYTLSTMSINSIEDVAGAVDKPFWFQLYVMRDRGFIKRTDPARRRREMQRADAYRRPSGARPAARRRSQRPDRAAGNQDQEHHRHHDQAGLGWSILKGKRKTFGNLAGHVKGMENINSLAQWTASQFDPTLNWKDVEWIKSIWPGKLILKGILDVEDARIAAKTGADAISVSNHGGRQLDGAPSAISALPRVVDAVGSQIEVMFDSGVRTGADICGRWRLARGLALSAARYIYGLGAGGQAGVAHAIGILGRELDVTMALCGVKNVRDISERVLAEPRGGNL